MMRKEENNRDTRKS